MAIEELVTAVPPPLKPIETGDPKILVLVEKKLGIAVI